MKLGIDIRTLMHARYSGVPEYTLNTIKAILAAGPAEDEYALFYNSFRDVSANIPVFFNPNVKTVRTRYPNKLFNYSLQKILKLPKVDKLMDVDLVFMPHYNFLSLRPGTKLVLTVHDLSFMRFPRFFSGRKNFWHWALNIKKLLERADRVVAISENTKFDILDIFGLPEEKVRVIHSGISGSYKPLDREKHAEYFSRVRDKYNLPDNFILYLGTLEPRKNVDGLIRAFNILRNNIPGSRGHKLVIAGARGWKFSRIFKEWSKSPYKDDIIFLGYVDNSDKVYLYNLCSVFVFPSFYEGFGFPPLEALASGARVVAGANSSLFEILGNNALLVDPYREELIAEAMADSLKKEAGIAFENDIADRFSWEAAGERYRGLFAELLDN